MYSTWQIIKAQKTVAHGQVPFLRLHLCSRTLTNQGKMSVYAKGSLDRLGVVSIFKGEPLGVVSFLLSFPQITSLAGFLQLRPPWGHLKLPASILPLPPSSPGQTCQHLVFRNRVLRPIPAYPVAIKEPLGLDPHLAMREHLRICSLRCMTQAKKSPSSLSFLTCSTYRMSSVIA